MSNQKNMKRSVDEDFVCENDVGKVQLVEKIAAFPNKTQRLNNLGMKAFHFVQTPPFFQVVWAYRNEMIQGYLYLNTLYEIFFKKLFKQLHIV